MKELQVKILLRNATEPEWAAANPVLMQGEAAITLGGSTPKLKIGDGTSTWSQLQYLSGYVPISSVFTIEHSGEAADAYAVGQALNNKISASDLATYLSNYATTASVNTKLSSYATTASMNTALAGKAGVNDKLANPYLLVIHSGGTTYSYDGSSRVEFTVSGSGGATSYNQLTDKPQINGVALSSDSTSSSLGIIKYGTKQYWASSTYVPKNGEIIVYTDYATKTVDGTSINIPNIKIGNGSSSLTGLPFILDKVDADIISVSQSLISHINDSAVHASANEKASWNAAVSASHSHDNKSILDTLTESKMNSWDGKSNFSGSYNDLSNKPTIPVIDSALDDTSTNGVQNKVIKAALDGKLDLTGGTITGDLILNTPYRDQYYASNLCRLQASNTPNQMVIKTKIKYVGSQHMPVIRIYGYAYGLQSPIELKVGFYIFGGNLGWAGAVSMGAWRPSIYLFKYTEDSVDYVALGLKGACYFPGFQVDAQVGSLGAFNSNFSIDGWKVTHNGASTSTEIIPAIGTDNCVSVPYKPVNFALTFSNSGNGAAPGNSYTGADSVAISYNSIGAAAASHTHTASDISGLPPALTIDDALSTTSVNAVQNKIITAALNGKAALTHSHLLASTTNDGFIPMDRMNFLGYIEEDTEFVSSDIDIPSGSVSVDVPSDMSVSFINNREYTITFDGIEYSGTAVYASDTLRTFMWLRVYDSGVTPGATNYKIMINTATMKIIVKDTVGHTITSIKGPAIKNPDPAFTFTLQNGAGLLSLYGCGASKASGRFSLALNNQASATGAGAMALGDHTNAIGNYSCSLGFWNTASGIASLTAGYGSQATGTGSAAIGYGALTSSSVSGQCAVGKYNESVNDALFVVGNGEDDDNRSNAFAVSTDGTIIATKLKLGDTIWEATTSCIGYTEIS